MSSRQINSTFTVQAKYSGGHPGLNHTIRFYRGGRGLEGTLRFDSLDGIAFASTNSRSPQVIRIPWKSISDITTQVSSGFLFFWKSKTRSIEIDYRNQKGNSLRVLFSIEESPDFGDRARQILKQYKEDEAAKEQQYQKYVRELRLTELPPYRFEVFVRDLFQKMGFTCKLTRQSADGGVDVVILKDGEKFVAQCKRYRGVVGEPILRDLLGTMTHEKATKGYLVTTGDFSQPAKRWSKGKNIELIDKYALAQLVRTYLFPELQINQLEPNDRPELNQTTDDDDDRPLDDRLRSDSGKINAEYPRTIDLDLTDSNAYLDRGIAHGNKGNLDQAILDFTRSIEADPGNTISYYSRGVAYSNQGRLDKAIEDYTKAIELDPKYADAYNNRGTVYKKKGNLDQAISDYTKAIEVDHKYADAYNNRAMVHGDRGDFLQAWADYDKAIELDPKDAIVYNNRGADFLGKYMLEQAIADFTKAIELDPKYAAAYYNRGSAYCEKHNFDQALSDCTMAIQIDPKDASAYSLRGRVYGHKNNVEQLIADFTKALELDPTDAQTYYRRGQGYRYKGDINSVIADWTRTIQLNPNHTFALENRANAYRELRLNLKALADFEAILKLAPGGYSRSYAERMIQELKGQ